MLKHIKFHPSTVLEVSLYYCMPCFINIDIDCNPRKQIDTSYWGDGKEKLKRKGSENGQRKKSRNKTGKEMDKLSKIREKEKDTSRCCVQ